MTQKAFIRSFEFLALPPELRVIIYKFMVRRTPRLPFKHWPRHFEIVEVISNIGPPPIRNLPDVSVRQTCKTICIEVNSFLSDKTVLPCLVAMRNPTQMQHKLTGHAPTIVPLSFAAFQHLELHVCFSGERALYHRLSSTWLRLLDNSREVRVAWRGFVPWRR
jgi:hypothetical protein